MYYSDDVVFVIPRSGQSLAYGAEGSQLLNNSNTYSRAKMLGSSVHSGYDSGVPALPPGLQMQPLKSTLVEAIDQGWANHIFAHTKTKLPEIIWMYHGWAGWGYENMRRGTPCWDKGVAQLSRVVQIAKERGQRVVVPCFDWMSGENNSAYWLYLGGSNPEDYYTNLMLEYSRDINEVYRDITGQSEQIPIIWCQTSSHTFYYQLLLGSAYATVDQPTTALVNTKLSQQYPDQFITAGAKYHLPYGSDRSVHLDSEGYQRWGRKRGQIFLQSIMGDQEWKPVQPINALFISPLVVQINYDVMFPPLVLDTSVVSDPGSYGYQYLASQGNGAVITNVQIAQDGRSVLLTFDREPKGLSRSIGYAYNNAPASTYGENLAQYNPPYPSSTGVLRGPRGCLRDSDPTSSFGQTMHNYAVHSITPIR